MSWLSDLKITTEIVISVMLQLVAAAAGIGCARHPHVSNGPSWSWPIPAYGLSGTTLLA